MSLHLPTYSQIISPEDYNRINTDEHLYIANADNYIKEIVGKEASKSKKNIEVVELGCGPGRILTLIGQVKNINLTGVDYDKDFIDYAYKQLQEKRLSAKLINSNVAMYFHGSPVDVFYSEGFHHHIKKGNPLKSYLENIYKQLKSSGVYICGDEFLPEYANNEERRIKALIWYSHIISNAQKSGFEYLAQEEAKTLLDDLNENHDNGAIKSNEQIKLILDNVSSIENAVKSKSYEIANQLAESLLNNINELHNSQLIGDNSIDLSRGDYKVSDSVFRKEVESVGFKTQSARRFGPSYEIGGVFVYCLRK